ncbi:MAG: hypothetical protein NTY77_12320 [Elusimicrobia bacterium]|nr:hypothetical protein [Elusimicrobiota bacterium]
MSAGGGATGARYPAPKAPLDQGSQSIYLQVTADGKQYYVPEYFLNFLRQRDPKYSRIFTDVATWAPSRDSKSVERDYCELFALDGAGAKTLLDAKGVKPLAGYKLLKKDWKYYVFVPNASAPGGGKQVPAQVRPAGVSDEVMKLVVAAKLPPGDESVWRSARVLQRMKDDSAQKENFSYLTSKGAPAIQRIAGRLKELSTEKPRYDGTPEDSDSNLYGYLAGGQPPSNLDVIVSAMQMVDESKKPGAPITPSGPRDNSFLYGTDKPNPAQAFNRHMTLLETGMFDMLMRIYNDEVGDEFMRQKSLPAKAKTGYFPDRRQKADATFKDYQATMAEFRKAPGNARLPEGFASRQRKGAFKDIASSYLSATAGGKGEPEKLSDFEADLLVSYFKWTSDADYNQFRREWIEVTVPRSPEEHFLLKQRISDSRAVLRSEMQRYVSSPPHGAVDPGAQFSYVAELLKTLLSADAAKLKPIYDKAGMKMPEKPGPKAGADGSTPESFVKRFTDQEHAVLTYVITSAQPLAEFKKDGAAADQDAAKAPELVAKWRKTAQAEMERYLKTTPPAAKGATMERLTPFEATYIQWRLKRVDPALWEQFERLAAEADAAAKADDKGAPNRLVKKLRALVHADLKAYIAAKDKTKVNETLPPWAQKSFKPETKFAELFPNPNPTKKPGEPGEDQKAEETPTPAGLDPVEYKVIRFLIDSEKDEAKRKSMDEALQAALKKPETDPERQAFFQDWQKKVIKEVGTQLGAKDHAAFLQKTGLKDPELAKYFCNNPSVKLWLNSTKAMDQAKKLAGQGDAAEGAAPIEQAKSSLDFTPTDEVKNICTNLPNLDNAPAAAREQLGTGGNPQKGAGVDNTGNVPSLVTGGEADKDKKAKFKLIDLDDQGKRDSAAFGIMTGGIFGLLAMGAAAGPAGIFAMAVLGGLCGFLGYALTHPKKKDKD